jgi:hypothetical protein
VAPLHDSRQLVESRTADSTHRCGTNCLQLSVYVGVQLCNQKDR